ncbi:beta-xylosidase [Caballeronia sp. TF1N1]|uniref:beta-xylosidase n=1 Tax=Caballeronia sp. TF1N1 TaxID=2878153 RepID=UPI001FD5CF21|nr:beta-xylosidase [Caballeronia sp. TF1N1]
MSNTSHRTSKMVAAIVAIGTTVFSTYGFAQIVQGSGSDSQESRASDSTSRANPAGVTVHESQKPQSKDAAGAARGPSAGKDHKTDGAGGFNNGLYGTGAGNNK